VACQHCINRDNYVVIGKPLRLHCDHCGDEWMSNEENKCLECEYFWLDRDSDGCLNDHYTCHYQGEGCIKEGEV
jgi:hypothetical protein